MQYYRAKKSYDNNSILIVNNELITIKEIIKKHSINYYKNLKISTFFELVEINKNKTWFIFWIRKEF